MTQRNIRFPLIWSLLLVLTGLQLHGLFHDHAKEAAQGGVCQACEQLAQQTVIVVPAPVLPPLPVYGVALPAPKAHVRPNYFVQLPQLRGPPAPLVSIS